MWVITPSWLFWSWRSFLYSSSVYSCHLFLISSASVRSIPFLSLIVPIYACNIPLVSLIFLKRSLVFRILLFSSISLHWSLRKSFLSPCYSVELWFQMGIYFLFSFAFQFSSVTQSCLTLCDHMDHSMPGLPVHHQLPEFTQTHLHWVGNAIKPSHPLSFPSPPAFNLSQHQGLFKRVTSLHQVAKVLEFQLQHQSFQWTLRTDLL